MNKRLKPLLIAFVMTLVAPAVFATTLKMATIAPSGTTWMKEFRAAGKEIAEKTDDRIKLKFFPGGVMGNNQSVLRKMRIGQLQGGALSSGALVKQYNGVQIYSLPFLFNSYDEVQYVRTLIDPIIKANLAKKGLVVLGISEGGFAYLFSDKQINGVADLVSQKVWVPEGDRIMQNAFKKTNVNPVPLPVSDVYTGLQTGLLDTVTINPTGAVALQWHTKVHYMVERPILFIMGVMVLDKRAFDKLSSADQQLLVDVVGATFKRLDQSNQRDDQKAINALKATGVKITEISDASYNEWRNLAEQSLAELANEGVYDTTVYRLVQQRLLEYRSNQ